MKNLWYSRMLLPLGLSPYGTHLGYRPKFPTKGYARMGFHPLPNPRGFARMGHSPLPTPRAIARGFRPTVPTKWCADAHPACTSCLGFLFPCTLFRVSEANLKKGGSGEGTIRPLTVWAIALRYLPGLSPQVPYQGICFAYPESAS